MPQTIFINRCVDLKNEVVWVAVDIDEDSRHCKQLYCGGDVNGAIKAAISGGLGKDAAIARAKAVLARKEHNDEIQEAPEWPSA